MVSEWILPRIEFDTRLSQNNLPSLVSGGSELMSECEAAERVPRLRWGRRRGRWRGQRQTTQRWMGMIQRP